MRFFGRMPNYFVCVLFGSLFFLAGPAGSETREVEKSRILFASVEEGSRILGTRDEYIESTSPLDRKLRMKTDREVSKEEFMAFLGRNVLPWEDKEKERIESVFSEVRFGLERASLPCFGTITVIKTTGEEEGNAAYTRGKSIVLPKQFIQRSEAFLKWLIAHELFHVFSRIHPDARAALYEAIGFKYCGDTQLPPSLAPLRLTNPDAPKSDYCIRVGVSGREVWAAPVLFSRTSRYEMGSGKGLLDYMDSALLVRDGQGHPGEAEGSLLVDTDEVTGFFDQVGRNTDYVTHPEEILADNFALLVLGEENAPSPEILLRIRDALCPESSGMTPRAPNVVFPQAS